MKLHLPHFPALLCFLFVCRVSPGADPAVYQTGKPDPRVAAVPAEIRQAIFTQPDTQVEPLVRSLLGGVTDPYLKVKIVHDWIAENIGYDVESYFAGGSPEASWQATLTRRKAFCQGYAELLQKMCQVAGLPCEVIPGYGRGFGFVIGQAENLGQGNHAWNAVKIADRWHLLDVTWDAGHVEGRSYSKQYGTSYLYLEPKYFLYTHVPKNDKWQLLDRPLTAGEFAAMPLLEGRFFEQGLRLSTVLRRLQPVGESVQFTVTAPDNIALTATLIRAPAVEVAGREPGEQAPERMEGRTMVRRGRSDFNILVTFPSPGRWGIRLFTKPLQQRGSYWQAATLEFEAAAGTPWTFAKTYSSVEGIDSFLETPVYAPLIPGKDQEFKIRVRHAEQVQLRIGSRRWIPMQQAAGDPELYQVMAAVPADTSVEIVARPVRGGNTYWTLVDYTQEKK